MVSNYLIYAFRSLLRQPAFSLIHIIGLSIGISAALVVYVIVRYEYSFDQFEPDRGRIYRVVMKTSFNGNVGYSAAIPGPTAGAIQNEVSGIDLTVPYMTLPLDGLAKVTDPENAQTIFVDQDKIVVTTPEYFQLVPHEWIAGRPTTSFNAPFSVVLTLTRARQYFPTLEPSKVVGRTLQYNQQGESMLLTVTGIVKELGEPSDLGALEFVSFQTVAKTPLHQRYMMDEWRDWMAYTKAYVKLKEDVKANDVVAQLNTMFKKYNPDAEKDQNNYLRFDLQPLHDIHFNADYAGFGQRAAKQSTLNILLLVSALLLLLGCINFTNLATAKGLQRAREIGIRKTSGGSRTQLIVQLLIETLVTTSLAAVLSIAITPSLLSFFSDFLPPGLTFNFFAEFGILGFVVCLTLGVSIIAGAYPALLLSGYKPAAVLKDSLSTGNTRSSAIRKTLTVTQFAAAQVLVFGAFIVAKQLHFVMNQDPGFRKEAIINFNIPRDTSVSHHEALVNTISALPEVDAVSTGFLAPMIDGAAMSNVKFNGGDPDSDIGVQIRFGDANYINLYKIKIVSGRNVLAGKHVEEVLVNESYVKALGFHNNEDILGKEVIFRGTQRVPIVGVMNDFHLGSYYSPIGPVVFQARENGSTFHVALKPQDHHGTSWSKAIQEMQRAVNTIYPET